MVNPVGQRTVDEVVNWNRLKLGVYNKVFSDCTFLFLGLFLVELVETNWRDVCSSTDTSNLSPQVVALIATERWIAENLLTRNNNNLISAVRYITGDSKVIYLLKPQ